MSAASPPLSVVLSPDALTLQWPDAATTVSAALLRVSCRCARCVSDRLRGAEAPPALAPTLVEALAVGHYALQLRFADGHDRGIYPWTLLRELGAGAVPPH
jgi:DUF971 family protein